MRARTFLATGLALTAGAGGGLAVGISGGGENVSAAGTTATNPNTAPAANIMTINQAGKLAAQFCSVEAYGRDDYKAAVGANLVKPIGEQDNSSTSFETPTEIAKKVAPNTAAVSLISTILNEENSGIASSRIAEDASSTLGKIESDPTARAQMCGDVVIRILTTPKNYDLASTTSHLVSFVPEYNADGTLANIGASPSGQVKNAITVFGIKPVAGSANEALDTAISNQWGITAAGNVIEVAQSQSPKEVKPSDHGSQVKASTKNNKVTFKVDSKGNIKFTAPQQQETGSAGGTKDVTGKGHGKREHQTTTGAPEDNPNGSISSPKNGVGPSKANGKAPAKTGTGPSPSGGGPGGGPGETTTTTKTSTTPAETTATQTTTGTGTGTTTATTTTTTPATVTQTQTIPTTTTGSKGSIGGAAG
jgi:hypothetical protein